MMDSPKKETLKCGVCRQIVCFTDNLESAFIHKCLNKYEDLLIDNKYLYGRSKLETARACNESVTEHVLQYEDDLPHENVIHIKNGATSDQKIIAGSPDRTYTGKRDANNQSQPHNKNQNSHRAPFENIKESNVGQSRKLKDQDSCNDSDESTKSNINHKNKWSAQQIDFLIAGYIAKKHKFDSPQYNAKQVWDLISKYLAENGVVKNGTKCAEKWRNLKKMYEKIKKHNKATGNDRKTWVFYKRLDELYLKNASINPIATVSSTGKQTMATNDESVETEGLKRKFSTQDLGDYSYTIKKDPSSSVGTSIQCNKSTNRGKKRIAAKMLSKSATANEAKERRHKERLEQKDKMFSWFKSFMTEKKTEQ